MKLPLLILSAAVSISSFAQPAYNWAGKVGGTSTDQAYSIGLDAAGNVYVMGKYYGTPDFDPGAGTYTMTVSTSGYWDVFFAKYTSAGNFVWAKHIGNPSAYTVSCEDMAVDAAGNVYLTGSFDGTTDFDPNGGTTNLTSAGSAEIFFAKYNSNGNMVWAKSLPGSAGNDEANAIAVDASGNIYLTGYHSTVDFDPGGGTAMLNAFSGYWAAFFAKYDANGNYIWARNIASNNANAISEAIHVDNAMNVYLGGQFNYTIDFDPGGGVANVTGGSSWDLFFCKYDSNGNYAWANGTGSTGSDIVWSIATDPAGNVWPAGDFQGTVDFNTGAGTYTLTAGSTDGFFGKYDSNGNFIFAGNISSANGESVNKIITDASGNILVTGYHSASTDFDPGAGTVTLPATALNIFLAKYSSAGAYLWAAGIGAAGNDIGYSMALSPSGYLHATGHFNNTADFDPGAGIANLTSAGNEDVFIAKYYLCENFSVTVSSTSVTCNGGTNGSAAVIPSGGTAPYTYAWSNSGTTPSITGIPSALYTATVTSSEGCMATQTVSVAQPSSVTVTITKNESPCGQPNSMAAAAGGGTPGYTFLWSTGSSNDSLFNRPQGNYSVTVTDANGCTGSDTAYFNVLVWPPVPICLITVDSTTSTRNEIVWEKPLTAGIDSFRIYRLIGTMTHIASVSYDSLSVYIDTTNGVNPQQQAYEYALSVLDTCGNESALSAPHTTIHQLTPQYTPPNLFDLQWSDYMGYSFTDYEIWRDSIHNNNWQKIGTVPFTLSNTFTDLNAPNDSCRYRIEAAHPTGCTPTTSLPNTEATTLKGSKSNSSERNAGPVGIQDIGTEENISIYPNPSGGHTFVKSRQYKLLSLHVYNTMGEKVFSKEIRALGSSLDLSDLPDGVYQIRIVSDSCILNRKLVISR